MLAAFFFAQTSFVHAAVVTAEGAQLNLGDAWRDSTVLKTHDSDGDNVYGSLGYIMFNTHTQASGAGVGATGPLDNATLSLPGIAILATGANAGYSGNYSLINDPNAPPPGGIDLWSGVAYRSVFAPGGLAGNTEYAMFDITFNGIGTSLPNAIRLGIFVDNEFDPQNVPIGLRIAGAGGDSGNVLKLPTVQSNDYYFFDLTGLSAGDTITVFATSNTNAGALTLGGFTFDAVPEPSATVLTALGLGIFGIACLRRRALAQS